MHLSINVKPEGGGGGGGGQAYVGHLTSIASPTLVNLTMNLGPKVGMFVFLCRGRDQVTSSHVLVCVPAILEVPVWRLKAFQTGQVCTSCK